MATPNPSASSKTAVPDGIYFELSPRIVLGVRITNILVLLMVVITFILCLVQGGTNSTYYLLACNTVISAFVCIVVNWWYRSGDLGSEKFWYILVVAVVLVFQCITTDIFVFKSAPIVPLTTVIPTTEIFSWASFRTTTNASLLHLPLPATKSPFVN